MAVANSSQMLKTVIMDFSVIKPHFSRRLSRLIFSAGSRLSCIFCGRLACLAQITAVGSRRLGAYYSYILPSIVVIHIRVRGQSYRRLAEYNILAQSILPRCSLGFRETINLVFFPLQNSSSSSSSSTNKQSDFLRKHIYKRMQREGFYSAVRSASDRGSAIVDRINRVSRSI